MSDKLSLLKKKYSPIVQKHFENIELLPEVNLTGKNDFSKRAKTYSKQIVDLVLWKYKSILDNFVFGNSFIGNDYYLLKYTSYQLLIYWYILAKEELSNNHTSTCKLEIESQFYFFINCIYNIKEKFETFTNFQHKRIVGTILLDSCAHALEEIYDLSYSHLEKYCRARGYAVHRTYAMSYDPEMTMMYISCFAFTLSEEALQKVETEKIRFKITPPKIIDAVKSVFGLTEGVLDLLKDLKNIDHNKLISKFIHTTTGGKRAFKISF